VDHFEPGCVVETFGIGPGVRPAAAWLSASAPGAARRFAAGLGGFDRLLAMTLSVRCS
jgi:hypothetical protein